MTDLEIWRPAAGFLGFYEVSTAGRVRSVDRVITRKTGEAFARGKVLKPHPTSRSGHLYVNLQGHGIIRRWYVHRLVATLFFPCTDIDRAQVRHLDGDPTNNHVENLAWGTQSDNELDKRLHGRVPAIWEPWTACKNGHSLQPPNIRMRGSSRGCVACHRADARVRDHASRGVALPFKELADKYFKELMASENDYALMARQENARRGGDGR